VAATKPGECGSRVGGVARAGFAIVCGAGAFDGAGAADCAATEAVHVSKIIDDTRFKKRRNVDSLFRSVKVSIFSSAAWHDYVTFSV
jgi:hypothetical protein